MSFLLQLSLFTLASAASLAEPSGPFGVGFAQHVVQHTTPDDPTPGLGNELLVHLYYPTRHSKLPPAVPYFEPESEVIWNELVGLPEGSLLNLTTALLGNASFLDAPTGRPTVFFSPGGGVNAWMNYGLLADLASHGYTVLAIDHPGEPPALRWPNGTETIGWDIHLPYTPTMIHQMHVYRVADLEAVFSWFKKFARKMHAPFDTSNFFTMGHSLGGSASVAVAPSHPEVKAAVNLDGAFPEHETTVTDAGLPVFLMSSINHTVQMDPSWTEFQNHQTSWWESVSIYGSGHLDYSDITTWIGALGYPPLVQAEFGPTGGVRTVEIARKYVGDFFAWVEGEGKKGKGVLAAPSLKWKEVVYVNGTDFGV